jgi:hypothetical protein
VPEPLSVTPPGEAVRVHDPEDGKPLRRTLPVATAQVGWTTVPVIGAEGFTGWALITTLTDTGETQPEALVTVKV